MNAMLLKRASFKVVPFARAGCYIQGCANYLGGVSRKFGVVKSSLEISMHTKLTGYMYLYMYMYHNYNCSELKLYFLCRGGQESGSEEGSD